MLTEKSRLVGIDYGLARLGVSLSDPSLTIASPLMILPAAKKSAMTAKALSAELLAHAKEHRYRIAGIVMGYPLMMSGKQGMLADEVKAFVELLRPLLIDVEIVLWDERLTSVQAERSLRETTLTRKRRAKVIDSVAATLILQNYLDHLNHKKQMI